MSFLFTSKHAVKIKFFLYTLVIYLGVVQISKDIIITIILVIIIIIIYYHYYVVDVVIINRNITSHERYSSTTVRIMVVQRVNFSISFQGVRSD